MSLFDFDLGALDFGDILVGFKDIVGAASSVGTLVNTFTGKANVQTPVGPPAGAIGQPVGQSPIGPVNNGNPWPLTVPGSSSWWLRPIGEPAPTGGATGMWQGPPLAGAGTGRHPTLATLGMGKRGPVWMCPGGYHASWKSRYATQEAPACVRNRRMNYLNIRAAHRSIRRLRGCERITRQILHFISPKKARGTAKFRGVRRKKCKTGCR